MIVNSETGRRRYSPTDVVVDPEKIDPALEMRGHPERRGLRGGIFVEIFLVDAADRRAERQKCRRRVAKRLIGRSIVPQIVVGDHRSLAVREENDAVVALIADEALHDEA